jgi:mono/diheme cytochrome c family protein
MYRVILLLLAAFVLQAQDAKNGKALFDTKYRCYTCHGFDGHGGQGARLVPMKLPQAAFIAYVRNPRQMPAYSAKILPDAELADIWTYVKSIPESPDAKSIPMLTELLK